MDFCFPSASWPRKEEKDDKPRNVDLPLTSNERARRLHPAESIERVQVPLHLDLLRDPFQAQARSCEPPQSAIQGTSPIAVRAPGRFPSPRGDGHVRGRGCGH